MKLKGWSETNRRAREARKQMTAPELRLWLELRREPDGLHFRREHGAGPYRLDFYCAKARLCIEVDSEAHERGDRPERDARRDAWLTERGVATLRIPAAGVMSNLEGVVTHIVEQPQRGSNPFLPRAAGEVACEA